jgi:hypothetical protein
LLPAVLNVQLQIEHYNKLTATRCISFTKYFFSDQYISFAALLEVIQV